MKIPRRSQSPFGSPGMMPMIDVVFLLLIYFLWTTSFDPPPYELLGSIAMPPASHAVSAGQQTSDVPLETFDEMIVRLEWIDSTVRVTLNKRSIADDSALRSRVGEIIELGVNPPIIIDPDPDVPMAIVVQYYDAARLGGGDRVMFAVDQAS